VTLRLEGYIDLPEHRGSGGFDHAAIHRGFRRLYVAHTANDAIDVIDLDAGLYVESIDGLMGVAGALVDETSGLVFTSNRGDDSVGIFNAGDPTSPITVPVGVRPNGFAFDPTRRTLLAANVGDPADPSTHTVSIVDVDRATMVASIPVPGRTRWTVFDPTADAFFVNIAEPPAIVMIDAADATKIARMIPVGPAGPHGLDVDGGGRLFCACDAGRLLVHEPPTYGVVADLPLSGAPDVIFLDPVLNRRCMWRSAIQGSSRSSTSIGRHERMRSRPSRAPTRSPSMSTAIVSTPSCPRLPERPCSPMVEDGSRPPAVDDAKSEAPLVVFVCRHGAAKSVLAAAELRRAAQASGIAISVRSAGIDPDPQVAPNVIASLPKQAAELRRQRPRRVTVSDLTVAWRVITFNLDPSELPAHSINVQQWDDLPAVSDDPTGAQRLISRHVAQLLRDPSLTGQIGSKR